MANERTAPVAPRLRFAELRDEDHDSFHQLVTDQHVRQFLLDGQPMTRQWSHDAIRKSQTLFERSGLGLWLLFDPQQDDRAIGFAGYWVFDDIGPELQLVYAFAEQHTGRGLATEAARTLIDYARDHTGCTSILATVDEPNRASIRVLEKLGFARVKMLEGAFGAMPMFRLDLASR